SSPASCLNILIFYCHYLFLYRIYIIFLFNIRHQNRIISLRTLSINDDLFLHLLFIIKDLTFYFKLFLQCKFNMIIDSYVLKLKMDVRHEIDKRNIVNYLYFCPKLTFSLVRQLLCKNEFTFP
ncbi:hypothetical protein L9F63_013426, partial [Diploptera punctata]